MPERMTVEGLIEELRRVAAESGTFGGLLPVMIEGRDRNLRYKPWLHLDVREIYTYETGEAMGKGGHTSVRSPGHPGGVRLTSPASLAEIANAGARPG